MDRPDHRTPWVRLSQLLDPASITPLHPADDSGVQAVTGRCGDLDAVAYCTDATRMGGALGAGGADRIIAAIEHAVATDRPVIGIWHSGGAKLADGVESMDGVGRMFAAMTHASGRIPQISVVVGPAAGAAAYGPALTDVVVMAGTGRMFITGPDIVRSVTGEQVDMESLGGPAAHARSGVVHVAAQDEADAYDRARRIAALLWSPGADDPMLPAAAPHLAGFLPESPRRAYDIRPLTRAILDEHSFEELQARWAPNMVVGLGRLAGRPVGVLANNPIRRGGCLDSLSAEKAARFVQMCDAFGVPLLVLVDVPGYLPGATQEWGGVIRRGAKLLHAFAASVVPRVTLIVRKSYGGAYIAMNSRSLGASAVYAWPAAEVAVMGAESAVELLHRRALAAEPEPTRAALRARLKAEHEQASGGVTRALSLGVVDEVIEPAQTRIVLAETFAKLPSGRGTHRNVPL